MYVRQQKSRPFDRHVNLCMGDSLQKLCLLVMLQKHELQMLFVLFDCSKSTALQQLQEQVAGCARHMHSSMTLQLQQTAHEAEVAENAQNCLVL